MNPFSTGGSRGAACAQWIRQQATATFTIHVDNALSLALGAEAGDKEHLTVVVLAMKKDGLVLPSPPRGAAGALACPDRVRRDGRVLSRSGRHASASGRTRMSISVVDTVHF